MRMAHTLTHTHGNTMYIDKDDDLIMAIHWNFIIYIGDTHTLAQKKRKVEKIKKFH